jgi:hypothetical protein
MSTCEHDYRRRYERVYPVIAGTLQRLCDRYGQELVLGVFSTDMPRYFEPREREERHRRALKVARGAK